MLELPPVSDTSPPATSTTSSNPLTTSTTSHATTSTASDLQLAVIAPPHNTHAMTTRSKKNISKPKQKYGLAAIWQNSN